MEKLTTQEVRKALDLFWTAFLAKSEDVLNNYYAADSSVFQLSMTRTEPGRLGAMRRSREYFHKDTLMDLKLGAMDIALVGNDMAVATYTFQFQATGRDVGGGKRIEEKLSLVRATQVLHRDAAGKIRIVHEHFSLPAS